ncbi:MAG: winged helix-turn-helix domain-containing protein [Nitrososphaerales archaeon]
MSQVFNVESTPTTVVAATVAKPTKFKNRSRMEIVANILDIARMGALKTHLMYKANLSYMVVSQYLEFLTRSELIKETFDDQGMVKLYQTTPKGLKYLEVYGALQNIAGIDVQRGMHRTPSDLFG